MTECVVILKTKIAEELSDLGEGQPYGNDFKINLHSTRYRNTECAIWNKNVLSARIKGTRRNNLFFVHFNRV